MEFGKTTVLAVSVVVSGALLIQAAFTWWKLRSINNGTTLKSQDVQTLRWMSIIMAVGSVLALLFFGWLMFKAMGKGGGMEYEF